MVIVFYPCMMILSLCSQHQYPWAGMAGDVNLFLDLESHSAEIEIMIAEISCRRKGLATEALKVAAFGPNYWQTCIHSRGLCTDSISNSQLMMEHGTSKLGITRFVAKILGTDIRSKRWLESI